MPEPYEFQDIEWIQLAPNEIKEKTDDELKSILAGEFEPEKGLSSSLRSLIEIELHERALKKYSKPHWSITPNFWLVLITVIIGAIGVYFTYLGLSAQKTNDNKALQSDGYDKSQLYQEKSTLSPEASKQQTIKKNNALTDEPLYSSQPDPSKTQQP